MLRGRTARDYLRLVGGRFSRLELMLRDPRNKRPRVLTEDEKLLQEIFRENGLQGDEIGPSVVGPRLRVDTLKGELNGHTISLCELVRSASNSDEFYIFSCSCGTPECADIWRGIETIHEDGLVVWRIRGVQPRRVVVFDREQYRREILSKVPEALALHRELGDKDVLGAGDCPNRVRKALYEAEEASEQSD